jgi:anti-sigma factor RsiW
MQAHVDDQDLILSLDGELPPGLQSRVVEHIDMCHTCREKAARFRAVLHDVTTFHRAEHDVRPGSTADARVRLERALRHPATSSAPSPLLAVRELFAGGWLLRGVAVPALGVAIGVAVLVAARGGGEAAGAGAPPGALPQSALTPGAVSQLTAAELCNGVRPSRLVTEDVRQQVLGAYGMERVPADAYELDALITPELGGSTDPANLWPQRYYSRVWNAYVKDELERLLPEMVCSQQISLAQAQRDIATDWIAAYKRYFRTEAPLQAHLDPREDEAAELLFVRSEPPAPIAAVRLVRR